jgi:16S rRNA (guanine527-N7)-methyltransferase
MKSILPVTVNRARLECRQMTRERISQLLAPFLGAQALSEDQLAMIREYLSLLLAWNAKINLTAVRDPDEIVTRHFGESLFAARLIFTADSVGNSLIDVGTGAGFPGLPAKIWAPGLELTLIESQHKKAVFLKEVIRKLPLPGVAVLATRAERVRIQADVVTLRAVERFQTALHVVRPMVKPGGRLGLLIGESQIEDARRGLGHVLWEAPRAIPLSRNRALLVGRVQPHSSEAELPKTRH